jgi:hypothetical protein
MAKGEVIDYGAPTLMLKAPFITDLPITINGDRVVFLYDFVNYNTEIVRPNRSMSRQEQELLNYKEKRVYYEKTFNNKLSCFIATVQAVGDNSVPDKAFGYKHIVAPKQRVILDGAREFGTITINGIDFLQCRNDSIIAVINEPVEEMTFDELYEQEKKLFFTAQTIISPVHKLILPENGNA